MAKQARKSGVLKINDSNGQFLDWLLCWAPAECFCVRYTHKIYHFNHLKVHSSGTLGVFTVFATPTPL